MNEPIEEGLYKDLYEDHDNKASKVLQKDENTQKIYDEK